MLHAHKYQPNEGESAEIVDFPAKAAAQAEFGKRAAREPFSLIVDLSAEELGLRWLRGAATLALLCGAALMLSPSPGFGSLPGEPADAGIVDAQSGRLDLPLLTPAAPVEAERQISASDVGKIETAGGDPDAVRISGQVSGGLYWSLREAGVSPETAADYLKAVATRIDVGEISPFDRFDLVVARGDAAPLLYAGLTRAHGSNVELLIWTAAGRTDWFDADPGQRSSDGLMTPVAGRITSGFGRRVHPILRFARNHRGVDFSAAMGSPIVAAADGQVVGTGWNGGYGRQVRVAHGGGVVTTYSHMSGIAAAPGTAVRQGEVIGYVGSTGLSTGPHLHFEVLVGGRAVDPLSVRLSGRPALEGAQLAAFKARLKQLLALPAKRTA